MSKRTGESVREILLFGETDLVSFGTQRTSGLEPQEKLGLRLWKMKSVHPTQASMEVSSLRQQEQMDMQVPRRSCGNLSDYGTLPACPERDLAAGQVDVNKNAELSQIFSTGCLEIVPEKACTCTFSSLSNSSSYLGFELFSILQQSLCASTCSFRGERGFTGVAWVQTFTYTHT